ncbi:MAG: gfo/Idh/MocA family oxidoreductase [Desulfovibrio sp.]|nr:MAG: gfo/Idh/MocA family oxidoreductase [Desulfovibrio sp.]
MNVGVIGLGWMGKVHLRLYSELRGVNIAGVVDVDPEALGQVQQQYGVPTFSSLDEFLENDLDAVSVCVPTGRHHEIGLQLIAKGVPLLMEKPLAATVGQGRELVTAARAAGVPLMVGHLERFNPAVARIAEIIQDDDVISIQIERVGPYPPRIQDVGVIKDLGSHDIDLVAHISGSRYKRVFAVTSTTLGKHEDTALISAEMENGTLAQITTNWITPYKSRTIHVATKTRYIEANLITQQVKEYSKFETYQSSYNVREWPLVYREPVREELTRFLAAIRSGSEMPITGEDGLYVLETIERIETFLTCQGETSTD